MTGPSQPRSCLAGLAPPSSPHDHHWDDLCRRMLARGIAIFRVDDPRLTWVEREQVRQMGGRIYGSAAWRNGSGR